jgi:hypothetical protein
MLEWETELSGIVNASVKLILESPISWHVLPRVLAPHNKYHIIYRLGTHYAKVIDHTTSNFIAKSEDGDRRKQVSN